MKKIFATLIITLLIFESVLAQGNIKYGVTGGLLNSSIDIKISNLTSLDAIDKTGFYIGALLDIEATDKLHIQPELTYGSAGNLSFVYLPVLAKYYITEGLNVQAGPQFVFSSKLDDIKQAIQTVEGVLGVNNNLDDVLNTVGMELGFGVGYDISENLMIQVKYAFALTDWYSGPLGRSLGVNSYTLNIGVAYFFN